MHIATTHRVAAGVNAAYDYFPCQFQLFYRGQVRMWGVCAFLHAHIPGDPMHEISTIITQKHAPQFHPPNNPMMVQAKKSLWYDPIFRVKTLDGRDVWRERHYRVRRAQRPGTFYLSVLDNGVTSNEYWRVMDCDEALEWCLFYYSGAASVAGVSYSGAILATKDGAYPVEEVMQSRVKAAMDRAGLQLWELSTVDNSGCDEAPLRPIAVPAAVQGLSGILAGLV